MSAPAGAFGCSGRGRSSLMRRGEVTPPYGSITGGAQQRADVPKAWLPPLRPAGDEGRHAGSSCPTGGCGEPPRLPWVAAHSGASAPRSRGNGRETRQRSPQKCPATPDNPSVTAFGRASSLCTREPLGTGDADCRVASLLAMTVLNLCHFEEAQRADVGIRPFLRWTGGRAAVPRAWPPPAKFRSEIWGVGQVVGPYGRSTEVPATGRCGHRPLRNETEARCNRRGSA